MGQGENFYTGKKLFEFPLWKMFNVLINQTNETGKYYVALILQYLSILFNYVLSVKY